MAGHWTHTFSFVTGAVKRKNFTYIVLSDDQLNEDKIPHSGFIVWDAGKWGDAGRTKWYTAGITVAQKPKIQMCAVGIYGGALLLGSGDRHEEEIKAGQDVPKSRGPLRGVRNIGDHVYVVGMGRQAWRRDGENAWSLIDQGARPPADNKQVVGFEAVDGFSESEIYAVGWDGEIWKYDGKVWKQIDSPTNLVLTGLCCAGDGKAYATGRKGLLLRGRDAQWEVVDHESMGDDIWGSAWYNGKLYVSTMSEVYTFENDKFKPVDWGADAPNTCYHLNAADGVLWSFGAKDLMAYDGKAWTRIDG
jgi:hypothetical protein